MFWLKQSTAITVKIGPFLDSTNGNDEETGLTINQADVRLSKNGGDYAQKNDANACVHDEKGEYSCQLNTTDTGTLGRLKLLVHVAGALAVWHEYMVVPANVWDSLFGSDKLQVDLTQIDGQNTNGNNATLNLKQLDIQNSAGSAFVSKSTGGDGYGMDIAGNGTGEGVKILGGATRSGLICYGGASAGSGAIFQAQAGNNAGLNLQGFGSGCGLNCIAGATGNGIKASGGASGGAGIKAYANANNDAGMELVKNGTGKDLDADDLSSFTAARAGYLDELAAANIPADLDNVLADTNELQGLITDSKLPAQVKGIDNIDLSATMKTSVNTEVVDALNVDTYAEPGQENPPATTTLVKKIGFMYKSWRNKITNDGSTVKLHNDAGVVVDQKATVSKADSTVTKGEFVTGP